MQKRNLLSSRVQYPPFPLTRNRSFARASTNPAPDVLVLSSFVDSTPPSQEKHRARKPIQKPSGKEMYLPVRTDNV